MRLRRERRKQKYSTLQDTVEELSTRLGQLSTLEAANSELHQRNNQLEVVVKDQNTQLMAQKDTITRQAQQLQTQVGVVRIKFPCCALGASSFLAAHCPLLVSLLRTALLLLVMLLRSTLHYATMLHPGIWCSQHTLPASLV